MSEPAEKPRRRVGRPPKAPEKGRRQNYTCRLSDETRDKLIAAAADTGRSMSEEMERRLDESFSVREIVEATINSTAKQTFKSIYQSLFESTGGPENFSTGFFLASIFSHTQERAELLYPSKSPWHQDPEKRKFVEDELVKSIPAVVSMLARRFMDPSGNIEATTLEDPK